MGVTDDYATLGKIKADKPFSDIAAQLKELQKNMGQGSGQGGKYLTGDRLSGMQNILKGSLEVQKAMLYNLKIIAKRTSGGGGKRQKDPTETVKKVADAFDKAVNQLKNVLAGIMQKLIREIAGRVGQILHKLPMRMQAFLQKSYASVKGFVGTAYKNVANVVKGVHTVAKHIGGFAKKAWDATGGKISKAVSKTGLPGGIIGLAGISALMGKMISASPLLQAMFKIMNTSLTLILRPIGDFFGAFLRPMSIYFLKEVAIPFFKAGRGWMKEGEKWGRIAVGFFVDPVMAIYSGVVKAFSELGGWINSILPWNTGPATPLWVNQESGIIDPGSPLEEAQWFQDDPAAWMRWKQGLEGAEGPPAQTLEREKQAAEDVANKAKSTAWWDNVFGILAGATGTITVVLEGAWEGIVGFFEDVGAAIEGISNWFGDVFKGIGDALQATGNWLMQAFSDIGAALEKAGQDFWAWITSFLGIGEAFAEETEVLKNTVNKGGWDLGKALSDGIEWIAGGIREGLDWLAGGIKSGIDAFLSMFGIKTAETAVALEKLADSVDTAGTTVVAAADVATGGIFSGSGHGRETSAGTGENPWNPIDAIVGAVTGQPSNVFKGAFGQPTTSGGLYSGGTTEGGKTDSGWSNAKLGEFTTSRFESSPGKFNDIYKTVEGVKTKIDPQSAEGKQIQAIYQKQYENKEAAKKSQEHLKKVNSLSGEEAKAYILAGGGEAGMAAVEVAKKEGLNVEKHGDLAALNTLLGGTMTHVMVSQAETAVIQAANAGVEVKKGESISQAIAREGKVMTGGKIVNRVRTGPTGGNPGGRGPGGSGPGGGTTGGAGPGGGTKGTGGGPGTGGGGRGPGGSGPGGGGTGGGNTGGGTKGTGGGKGSNKGGRKGGKRGRQFGGIIDEPIIGIGMHTGDEWSLGEAGDEMVVPMDDYTDGNRGAINVLNIHIGNITKEADYLKLKPLVQRWMLEAASRRGMV